MSTNIQYIQNTVSHSLADILNRFESNLKIDFNCHHIGTITSFDPTNQTAMATINYTKSIFVFAEGSQTPTAQYQNYTPLMNCPVICLGGGNGSLTFPIQPGDECLILFNDRNLDNWFQGSNSSPVRTPRTHSFSDGIILVGLRSLPNSLENYDTERVVLSNGTTLVGVGPDLIKIANETTTLNTLMQSLMTNIENLTTILSTLTTAMSTANVSNISTQIAAPSGVATTALTALSTSLTTLANEISELLE